MIRAIYEKLWLKFHGYCKHGEKWRFVPPGYYSLRCNACADPVTRKRFDKAAKAKAYARNPGAGA